MSSASKKSDKSTPVVRAHFSSHAMLLGILGWPVGHSMSPIFQNGALGDLGMDAVYLPFAVPPEKLGEALIGLRAAGFSGLNLTMPHKEAALPFLGGMTDEARRVGAVNTLFVQDGAWWGDNTDGRGYLADLKNQTGFRVKNKRVACFGAGGAARGILMEMGRGGVKSVIVINRSPIRAGKLLDDLRREWPATQWNGVDWMPKSADAAMAESHLIVNSTSCGLNGKNPLPFKIDAARKDAVVSDIVANPLVTPLVAAARKRKLVAVGGLGMLIEQGALGFKRWTGREMPREGAWKRLRAALR